MSSASRSPGPGVVTHAALRRRQHTTAGLRRVGLRFEHAYTDEEGKLVGVVTKNTGKHVDVGRLLYEVGDELYEAAVGPDPGLGARPVTGYMVNGEREVLLHDLHSRVAQRTWLSAASGALEAAVPRCSYAYGPHRHRLAALHHIRIATDHGYWWARRFDIKKFFPSVTEELVVEALERRTTLWPTMIRIVRLFLSPEIRRLADHPLVVAGEAPTFEAPRHTLLQGSIVAPALANVVGAHVLDLPFLETYDSDVLLFRYSDDGILLGRTASAVDDALGCVGRLLSRKKLTLHPGPAKTSHESIDLREQSVTFLGKSVSAGAITTPAERWKEKLLEVASCPPSDEERYARRYSLVASTIMELMLDSVEVYDEVDAFIEDLGIRGLVGSATTRLRRSRLRLQREFDSVMTPQMRKALRG